MTPAPPILRHLVRSSLIFAAVLGPWAPTAWAQGASPPRSTVPPPQTLPAPPPPQGPFPPPPPGFDGQPPPFDYPFAPGDPTGATVAARGGGDTEGGRRFSLTAALGPGLLIGPGERSLAMSYQLLRLGVGIGPNLALTLGYAGVGTNSVNPATGLDSWLKQDVWSLGLQDQIAARVYVRGGFGVGTVSESVGDQTFSGGHGLAVEGAVGYELLQRRHVALALEFDGGFTHYSRESWQTTGLQLAVSIF